ncbi:hypothetical protein I4F81_003681 [Pyropia yezoensis]|uniref:Uncharacterized protein n=1 Tax=Pyropia yezoensis TaxID=2788 RepID=A0ACC3BTA3_PYRYE|nr:hypothetical protein I4F81_003681 [Neopyropia yezoensis]
MRGSSRWATPSAACREGCQRRRSPRCRRGWWGRGRAAAVTAAATAGGAAGGRAMRRHPRPPPRRRLPVAGAGASSVPSASRRRCRGTSSAPSRASTRSTRCVLTCGWASATRAHYARRACGGRGEGGWRGGMERRGGGQRGQGICMWKRRRSGGRAWACGGVSPRTAYCPPFTGGCGGPPPLSPLSRRGPLAPSLCPPPPPPPLPPLWRPLCSPRGGRGWRRAASGAAAIGNVTDVRFRSRGGGRPSCVVDPSALSRGGDGRCKPAGRGAR